MEWSGTFRQEKRIIFFVPYLTRPHILRHTACTRFAEAEIDIKVVQYLMGHSDIKTTIKVYNHADVERARRAIEKYNELQDVYTNPYVDYCGENSAKDYTNFYTNFYTNAM